MAQSNLYQDDAARLKDTAERHISELSDRARSEVHSMAERGREMGAEAQQAAQSMVMERPLMSIALAAVLGFALGALWKS